MAGADASLVHVAEPLGCKCSHLFLSPLLPAASSDPHFPAGLLVSDLNFRSSRPWCAHRLRTVPSHPCSVRVSCTYYEIYNSNCSHLRPLRGSGERGSVGA